ncbi:MAG: AbrB/MazE/SpoVT family DNA-binding domain-containing protein [Nitrososphaeraceae archaeon]
MESEKNKLEYRKIQALVGENSVFCVLPRSYAQNLGIEKGDFVKMYQINNQIIIEKA